MIDRSVGKDWEIHEPSAGGERKPKLDIFMLERTMMTVPRRCQAGMWVGKLSNPRRSLNLKYNLGIQEFGQYLKPQGWMIFYLGRECEEIKRLHLDREKKKGPKD